jgi:hypothetical protein
MPTLLDWLDRLLTPCPLALRKMGFLRELLNIRACHGWWRTAWEPHLERSRAVIRAASNACPQHRKAIVLGSGLLLDVPLAELAACFREVILVDLLHPFSTRRQIRRFRNAWPVNLDLTGVIEATHRIAGVAGAELPRAAPDFFLDDPEVDLVASVNLLSQLPCLPTNYLRRLGVHSSAAIDAFARDIIRAHLVYLQKFKAVVALIADVEAITLNREGAILKRVSTVYGETLPWRGEEWIWRLIPLRRSPPWQSEWLRVVGIADLKSAQVR